MMDRMLAVWGTVGAVRMAETTVVDMNCIGLGGHSLVQRMIMAGVGGGEPLASPILPLYRLVVVEEVRSLRFAGHFVSWPVLCAKRGIISFQPLLMLVKSDPWIHCGSVCRLTCKQDEAPSYSSNDDDWCA